MQIKRSMMVNFLLIKDMVTAFILGPMGANMKDGGIKVNNMALGLKRSLTKT